MKYLYYCNSTYQLVSLLNLHYQRKYNDFENIDNYSADLIVLNAFDGAKEIVDILKKGSVFDSVWLIEKRKKNTHFKTFIHLLFPKNNIKEYISCYDFENKYDYINTPKYSNVIASIWQMNKKAKLQLLDEGLATYNATVALESHSTLYRNFYRFFNGFKDFNDYKRVYVNNLDFVISKNSKYCQIPKSLKIKKEIFSNFNGLINDEIEKNIIWFDQYYEEHNKKKVIETTLEELKKYKDEILFFPHPRKPYTADDFLCQKEKNLWEIRLINDETINNKCLITYNSTACFSPKIMFDYEPYIIMVYSLDNTHSRNFDENVNRLLNIYRDKEKIMIPKTEEELKRYINLTIRRINENKY